MHELIDVNGIPEAGPNFRGIVIPARSQVRIGLAVNLKTGKCEMTQIGEPEPLDKI